MSASAPTPLPTTAVIPDISSNSAADPAPSSTETPTPPPPTPFCLSALATKLTAYVSTPFCAAVLFAGITWGIVHFLGAKVPPSTLKLYAAGGFAAVMYGLAALAEKDPMVASKGLQLLSTSQLPVLKRLLAAWYLTFPALAIAAAFPKTLTTTTMVAAADAAMILISYVDQQGLLSKYM